MASNEMQTDSNCKKTLYPAVAMYGSFNVRNLAPGQIKLWCSCGLSKSQPWCDGSHKGTGFQPLKWTVPSNFQTQYQLCGCKHTACAPLCDGCHINIPVEVIKRQKECKAEHSQCQKLCTDCGWKSDW